MTTPQSAQVTEGSAEDWGGAGAELSHGLGNAGGS